MIQKEQLRIGNYVWLTEDRIAKVEAILNTSIYARTKNDDLNEVKYHLLEPIDLTPEILEKVGFENDENVKQKVYVFKVDNLTYSIAESQIEDGEMYISCDNAFSGINTVKVKYLHTLQNIIHSLSAVELTISL